GVGTRPARIRRDAHDPGVWIVPLFAWYVRPEEGDGSLFVPKPGEDATLRMWADTYLTRWPAATDGCTVAERFLTMNEPFVDMSYDAPVISFSHFLPRRDLIFSTLEDRQAMGEPPPPDPDFNFIRVAGCSGIDVQVRRLGARVHVYGNQHRSRSRSTDGV